MAVAKPKTRKRRDDCFFGIHIDLHPAEKDTELGRLVTDAMVRRIIRAARPDYIQYDCKGHAGYLGYRDSKTGVVAGDNGKGIIQDSLAIYRRATADMGVVLFVHFSGVWDNVACNLHPEWAAVKPDSTHYDKEGRTSTFGPYVTDLMIPEMKEVVDRYDVDGFWVDGDCWGAEVDYCDAAKARFRETTGRAEPPTKPGEPYWYEWMTIQRDQFFAYLRTYMDALHAHHPGVQVASNWLYTPFSPEPVKLPVDFISGDYSSTDSINSARLHGRYMASVGLPWDLMAWSFVWYQEARGHLPKPAIQLQQEAATVIALGGGFQFYFHPDRHGGFSDNAIGVMKQVGDFCRPRRAVCFKTQPLPQVAILLDTNTVFRTSGRVYSPTGGAYDALQGLMHAALEAGHSVDILADHHLPGQQDHWPVIAVPEWELLPVGVVEELVDYARRGGSLLITGAATTKLFAEHLGVELVGEAKATNAAVHHNGQIAFVKGPWQSVTLRAGKGTAKAVAFRTPGFKEDEKREVAATIAPLGRGKIAAVYGPIGGEHFHTHAPALRGLINDILLRLYKPIVRLAPGTPPVIDLVVRRRGEEIVIHLNNTAGMCTTANYGCNDHVPPTPPLRLTVTLPGKPRRATLEPQGKRLIGKWSKGMLTLTVPTVHIHTAIVVG